VVSHNYVHDNHGDGLWWDGNFTGASIIGNTVVNNDYHGIHWETGDTAEIAFNVSALNGKCTAPATSNQIYISTSTNSDVHDNNITVGPSSLCQSAIILQNQDRPDNIGFSNNIVHNNTVTFQTSAGLMGFYAQCDPGTGSCATPTGNAQINNAYYVASLSDNHWLYPTDQSTDQNGLTGTSWATYQATGQDLSGPATRRVGNATIAGRYCAPGLFLLGAGR
jgi:hypothetical protein